MVVGWHSRSILFEEPFDHILTVSKPRVTKLYIAFDYLLVHMKRVLGEKRRVPIIQWLGPCWLGLAYTQYGGWGHVGEGHGHG